MQDEASEVLVKLEEVNEARADVLKQHREKERVSTGTVMAVPNLTDQLRPRLEQLEDSADEALQEHSGAER